MIFKALRNALKKKLTQINPILVAENGWKRCHYILIEELINNNLKNSPLMSDEKRRSLGTTISHMTLKRFFEMRYDDRASQDLRFLKTVEKLCIFLGYPDFASYFNFMGIKTDLRSINNDAETVVDEDFFLNFIKKFLAADFECFKRDFSEIKQILCPFLFQDSPFFGRMRESRSLIAEKNIKLVVEGNRSSYELISAKVTSQTEDSCICETQEYWNMVYVSQITGERFIYNQNNTQMYFFQKRDGVWKIWNNFNPDAGKFVKEVELNPIL